MRRATLALAIGAAIALAWFGWPTPYRRLPMQPSYTRAGIVDMRVHRITGRVSVLTLQRGWQTLRTPYERAQARVRSEQLERSAPGDSFE